MAEIQVSPHSFHKLTGHGDHELGGKLTIPINFSHPVSTRNGAFKLVDAVSIIAKNQNVTDPDLASIRIEKPYVGHGLRIFPAESKDGHEHLAFKDFDVLFDGAARNGVAAIEEDPILALNFIVDRQINI